jgi:hypothetical protein
VSIARDYRVTDTYVLNVLPLRAMPERISHVRLRRPLRERPAEISLDGLGTFVATGLDLWSFVPLDILTERLRPMADLSGSEALPRAAVEDDTELKRIFSWLLRKHFESHLMSLTEQGLLLEDGAQRGRRAFFAGREAVESSGVWWRTIGRVRLPESGSLSAPHGARISPSYSPSGEAVCMRFRRRPCRKSSTGWGRLRRIVPVMVDGNPERRPNAPSGRDVRGVAALDRIPTEGDATTRRSTRTSLDSSRQKRIQRYH